MIQQLERPVRIGLVNLRARTNDWHHIIMVPLGIMYLSAALKKAFGPKVDVRLFDVSTYPEQKDPDEAIRAFFTEFQPDMVGIRGFTSQADEFPIVARIAKEVKPDCLVVAGGPHASTNTDALYAIPNIDLVCPYEGEETIVEIVQNLMDGKSQDKVLGTGHHNGTEPVR
ncbi:MAG TPA: cobalamin-dependent protein, partial [Planctomycetota bacterium]|nr:cobalamin-dependent protein [Planctomycetota bacterium]